MSESCSVCSKRSLTGKQGVINPAANVAQLMLHRNVVDAAAGCFYIYAVDTVGEALGTGG